jgi:hypothetical protein
VGNKGEHGDASPEKRQCCFPMLFANHLIPLRLYHQLGILPQTLVAIGILHAFCSGGFALTSERIIGYPIRFKSAAEGRISFAKESTSGRR